MLVSVRPSVNGVNCSLYTVVLWQKFFGFSIENGYLYFWSRYNWRKTSPKQTENCSFLIILWRCTRDITKIIFQMCENARGSRPTLQIFSQENFVFFEFPLDKTFLAFGELLLQISKNGYLTPKCQRPFSNFLEFALY